MLASYEIGEDQFNTFLRVAQMYIISNNRCHCYANKNGLSLQLLVVSTSIAQKLLNQKCKGRALTDT